MEMTAAGESTTRACVCTDAVLDRRGCGIVAVLDRRGSGIVARIAGAGIARAVEPAFTPLDGDIVFCVASGGWPPAAPGPAASWTLTVLGTVATTVTAAAIRDAVRHA